MSLKGLGSFGTRVSFNNKNQRTKVETQKLKVTNQKFKVLTVRVGSGFSCRLSPKVASKANFSKTLKEKKQRKRLNTVISTRVCVMIDRSLRLLLPASYI